MSFIVYPQQALETTKQLFNLFLYSILQVIYYS